MNSSGEQIRENEAYIDLRFEKVRLESFARHKWSSSVPVSAPKLAKAGFFYGGDSDFVACFSCGGTSGNWGFNDQAIVIHATKFPDCSFIKGLDTGNIPLINYSVTSTTTLDVEHRSRHHSGDTPASLIPLSVGQRTSSSSVSITSKDGSVNSTPSDKLGRTSDSPKKDAFDLKREEDRLATFRKWNSNVSFVELARWGFFYTGRRDTVECVFCHGRLNNWQPGEQPGEEHFNNFDQCPFMNGDDVGNVPVSITFSPLTTPRASRASASGNNSMTSSYTSALDFRSPGDSLPVTGSALSDPNFNPFSFPTTTCSSPGQPGSMSPLNLSTAAVRNSHSTSSASSSGLNGSRDAGQSRPAAISRVNQLRTSESVSGIASSSGTVTGSATIMSDEVWEELRNNDDANPDDNYTRKMSELGIFVKPPSVPEMATYDARFQSFRNWSSDLKQRPVDLAAAGFFYVGIGDSATCFQCNGGLNNWLPSDNVWVEHARWYPKCEYLRSSKGDQYVKSILMKVANSTVANSGSATSSCLNNKTQSNASIAPNSMMTTSLNLGSDSTPDVALPNEVYDDVGVLSPGRSFYNRQQQGARMVAQMVQSGPTSLVELAEIGVPIDHQQVIKAQEFGYSDHLIVAAIVDNQYRLFAGGLGDLIERMEVLRDQVQTPQTNDPPSSLPFPPPAVDIMTQSMYEPILTPASSEDHPQTGVLWDLQDDDNDADNDQLESPTNPTKLEAENLVLKEQKLCKICMDNDACIVFLPCGHLVSCSLCAPAMRQCPICRNEIKGTVRTYMA